MNLTVWQSGAKPHQGLLRAGDAVMRCALGRGGITDNKREGDGATPSGVYPLRYLLYRADRGDRPQTNLSCAPIGPRDGWCDDPKDVAYNQPVRLPYQASAESLTRRDRLYDRLVVTGHNEPPVVPGLGSAIFMHVARPDYGPTLGCIALAPGDLERVLRNVGLQSTLHIKPARA